MTIYCVNVREVFISSMQIEAESEEEAINKVSNKEGKEILFEYSSTLPKDFWTVDKEGD